MAKKSILYIPIDKEDYEKLKLYGLAKGGLPLSNIIRLLVKNLIKENKELIENQKEIIESE